MGWESGKEKKLRKQVQRVAEGLGKFLFNGLIKWPNTKLGAAPSTRYEIYLVAKEYNNYMCVYYCWVMTNSGT